jgi:hypothetical protein
VARHFAIITSKGEWIGFFDGQHFNQKCIVVDAWRMVNGQWKVVTRTSDLAALLVGAIVPP